MTPAKATLPNPASRLPIGMLLFSATLWGLSWWPLKAFVAQGLSGLTLSLLSYGPVGLLGSYFVVRERAAWRADARGVLLLTLVGGYANVAFVSALMLGDVVRVMLLFYLSPVWSVLGGRIFLCEQVSHRRLLAVGLALVGLWLVIGGTEAFSAALSPADWLALSAGLAFAGNNLISRGTPAVPLHTKTGVVFLGGGLVSVIAVGWQGIPLPALTPGLTGAVLLYGFGWLLLAMAAWQYGVTHLETGRAGVILITELLVAVLSAALFGDAQLLPHMWLGGLLIAAASVLEATDPAGDGHTPVSGMPGEPAFSTRKESV
jgi:drug/metabolite transporter (DMT)-like permease